MDTSAPAAVPAQRLSPMVTWGSDVWEVACLPEDGARLSVLRWRGVSLLTGAPERFRPPTRDLGRYELRPVYGYDDCFPTVDPCRYPGLDWEVPDHGELCWLPWRVRSTTAGLDCAVASRALALEFQRCLRFDGDAIVWEFQVVNHGDSTLPFLHVMHPLMPLACVSGLSLPPCREVLDETADRLLPLEAAGAVARFLLSRPPGTATMLVVRGLDQGELEIARTDQVRLKIEYPVALFPNLAIWWNREGYPDETGLRRSECAFEPNAGSFSSLARSRCSGHGLTVAAGQSRRWEVRWRLSGGPA